MFRKKNSLPSRQPSRSVPTRSEVFSYHAHRAPAPAATARHEAEVVRTSYRRYVQNIPAMLSAIVIISTLLYTSTLSSNARVVTLGDQSVLLRDQAVYQAYAKTVLRDAWWHYSKLTVQPDVLRSAMIARYPEIQDVDVTIPLVGRRPVVTIAGGRPALSIVGTSDPLYVTAAGKAAVRTADVATPPQDVPVVRDESGLQLRVGDTVLTKETVVFITEMTHQLTAAKISVQSLVLPRTPHELQIRIKDTPYVIRSNTQGDARVQAGTLIALLKKLAADGVQPKEYIDIRVEERVFYK